MGDKSTRRTFNPDWIIFPADPEGRACSPVKEYKLSPEELAEYDNLRKPTGKAPTFANAWKRKPKEAEDMDLINGNAEKSNENPVLDIENSELINDIGPLNNDQLTAGGNKDTVDPPAREPKPKTKMELAMEKMPKELYVELKTKNPELTDRELMAQFDIDRNTFCRLKDKWGLAGQALAEIKPPENTPQPEPVPQPEPEPAPAPVTQLNESRPSGLTIAQAMELRDELAEDIESLDRILDAGSPGEDVTERVYRVLVQMRDEYQARKNLINEVFERTVLPL